LEFDSTQTSGVEPLAKKNPRIMMPLENGKTIGQPNLFG